MNNQNGNFIKIINTALTGNIHQLDAPDSGELIKLAREQGVSPIFLEGIVKYDFFNAVPADVRAELIRTASSTVAVQTQRTAEFCFLYEQFLEAGLKPVILKGLVCRLNYGKLENSRGSGDEDVFIRKEDFETYNSILKANGFYPHTDDISDKLLENIHTVNYKSDNSSLMIELHLDLVNRTKKFLNVINDMLLEGTKDIISFEYNNKEYYTLPYTYNYIYLFFHYYKHFCSTGAGIRHIMDIALFAEKNKDKIDFKLAESKIFEYASPALYADTLAIAARLGFPVFTEEKIQNPDLLLDDLLDGGTFGFDDPEKMYGASYKALKARNVKFAFLRAVFLPFRAMANYYTELYDKPYKLPYYYIKRIFDYFSRRRNKAFEKTMFKSGKSRIDLIKGYNKKK